MVNTTPVLILARFNLNPRNIILYYGLSNVTIMVTYTQPSLCSISLCISSFSWRFNGRWYTTFRPITATYRPFSSFGVFECGRTVSCVKRFPVKTTMAEATSRCHCSVPHCSNNKQRQPYLSFHAFPSFEYDTNKWVHAIRRDQSPLFMILRGSTFVCSRCSILCQNSIPEVEFYSRVCRCSILCQNSIPVFVKGMLF